MIIIRYVTLYLKDQPQSRGHNPSCSRFLNSADPTILEPGTGYLRVPPGLCIKILSYHPLIRKRFFILMQIKLLSTRKVVHLASF